MQAMNGFAKCRRTSVWLLGCVLALAAIVIVPASAGAQQPSGGPIYMALGDSISFGYSEQRFDENYPTESPSRFESGVANDLARTLHKSDKTLSLVNLACPGETSNGLIGENPLLGGEISSEAEDPPAHFQGPGDWHPCAYHNADGFPLHAGYGKISQLEDAISILTSENKITKKPNEVKLITLNIGNNDVLGLLNQCEYEHGSEGFAVVGICFEHGLPATEARVVQNVKDTIEVLDDYYTGPIVLFGGYDPLAFVHPGFDEVTESFDAQFESVARSFTNVTIAAPFPIFNAGADEKENGEQTAKGKVTEQKAICKYTEMCNPDVQEPGGTPTGEDGDIHPSLKGYKVLAALANAAYEANPAK